MLKRIRTILALGLILTLFPVGVSASDGQSERQVKVKIMIDSSPMIYVDAAEEGTVSEVLSAQKIYLDDFDIVTPARDSVVEYGTLIKITKAFPIRLVIDGAETAWGRSPRQTVAEYVTTLKRITGMNFTYEKNDWTNIIEPGSVVSVETVSVETVTMTEEIPFDTEYVYTNDLDEGVQSILITGHTGKQNVTKRINFVGGKAEKTAVLKTEVISAPQNQVIEVGTKRINTVKGYTYTTEYIMKATAYTNDFASTGKLPGDKYYGITASGMKARVGVVAVDPNVIPLGTALYIENYGYAIAGDVGGGVKGLRIDLFYDTTAECMQFGRRDIKVWVLAE